MHNECRQVIEQMHVIYTQHHRRARGGGSQRLDHPAHQLNGVGATRLRRPSGESTQRKCPRRGCADGPMSNAAMRRGSRQPLAGDPALPDPRGTANHNPGRARFGYCGLNESHLLRAPSQRPRQPHVYRVRAQGASSWSTRQTSRSESRDHGSPRPRAAIPTSGVEGRLSVVT